jgi:hypothetical protein
VLTAILVAGLLGALLLIAAEFTTLFEVHVASSSRPVQTVSTGSHQSYALLPIALLVAVLAFGIWREASRVAVPRRSLLMGPDHNRGRARGRRPTSQPERPHVTHQKAESP